MLVSVDGLNPDAIRQLGSDGTPALHQLIAEGASTLNARTTYEETRTLPNHTSMVTSRPVTEPGGHQLTINDDNGSTVHAAAGTYVASIFDVVHDGGGSTALYAQKEKFDVIDRSWDADNGRDDTTGADDGSDKIDVYERAGDTKTITALRTAMTRAPADFSMIHLAGPDQVGHARGWLSQAYLAEVTRIDALIGDLVDAIAASAQLRSSTVVLLTSDHGGVGTGHATADEAANYTVPFLAWGAGVAAGEDLYALNADRADPGQGRPDYSAAAGPIRNAESGNLVADLLGFGPIPGSLLNADQSLDLAR